MRRLLTDEEILEHLQRGHPILDVRAPVEFAQGSLPGSYNIPLLGDDERARVGTAYKKDGPEAALKIGYETVSGEVARVRVAQWRKFVTENPRAAVMCFRGGQRSRLVQAELSKNGVDIPFIEGGFKRVRRLLSEQLDLACDSREFRVLSGYTGVGKTRILRSNDIAFLDLECHAKHRGSTFGNWNEPQPSPVRFENELGLEASRLLMTNGSPIWLEDESRSIGKLVLPKKLFDALSRSKVWILEKPRFERAAGLTAEYLRENYGLVDGVVPNETLALRASQDIGRAVLKIERRLGGAETKHVLDMTVSATQEFNRTGAFSVHWPWVERILETYYDPLYEKHLGLISNRVVGRGPEEGFHALVGT